MICESECERERESVCARERERVCCFTKTDKEWVFKWELVFGGVGDMREIKWEINKSMNWYGRERKREKERVCKVQGNLIDCMKENIYILLSSK